MPPSGEGFSSSCNSRLYLLLLCSLNKLIWHMQAAFGKTALNVSGLLTYIGLGLGVVCPLAPRNPGLFDDFNGNELMNSVYIFSVMVFHALKTHGLHVYLQLGGPLSLPWGLYILIIQVRCVSLSLLNYMILIMVNTEYHKFTIRNLLMF